LRAPLTVVTDPVQSYHIGLVGEHQKENAGLALEALHQLGVEMRYDTVKDGLSNVIWPGRFEVHSSDPLIVLDGAHNPHATDVLVKTWKEQYGELKPIVIFGATDSKDLEVFLKSLSEIAEKFIFTPINSSRSIDFSAVKDLNVIDNVMLSEVDNVSKAFIIAREDNLPILLTGSLYLLGEYHANVQHVEHISTVQ